MYGKNWLKQGASPFVFEPNYPKSNRVAYPTGYTGGTLPKASVIDSLGG